jgi:putative transposase
MSRDDRAVRWARFRFAVVGPLLASPPGPGELGREIERLAERTWKHPVDEHPVRFGVSTLERWYYQARRSEKDPVGALHRRVRRDAGEQPSLGEALRQALERQYREHRGWTVQLHVDNLAVLVEQDSKLGVMPSYATVRRYMRNQGMERRRGVESQRSAAWRKAQQRREQLEIRSYEVPHVHSLWHLDFHECSRSVVTASAKWVKPQLLGILDDHSRLCCHVQWYLAETTEVLVHGLTQAMQKRALPRSLMTDNGSAMRGGEFLRGIEELGIAHEPTLAHSAYQNGKQEVFWAQIEGRLLPMLENVPEITLEMLNEVTQAWVEQEYHHKPHDELGGQSPLERYLAAPNVGRPLPVDSGRDLGEKFRLCAHRRQRKSDGTLTIEGRRFEVPQAYRHLSELTVRYARWDLSLVHLYDAERRQSVCRIFPVDKHRNADAARAVRAPLELVPSERPPGGGMAPLLTRLLRDYRARGLAPAYLPHQRRQTKTTTIRRRRRK